MPGNRILTTHVGSLVRPPKLVEFLHKIEDCQPYERAAYEACLAQSIDEVVRQQAEAGIDIVSDGEFSKGRNWAFYIHDRLTGVTTRPLTAEEAKDPMAAAGGGQDRVAFPEFYAEYDRVSGLGKRLGSRFVVDSALTYSDAAVKRDIANLKAAVAKVKVQGAFLPVVAPASALPNAKNEHYADEPSLLSALADRPLRADRRRLPAVHARKDGAADDACPVSELGADAHRRAQPGAQGHSSGALALSHLLGQLERAARLRRADEGHRRPDAAGERGRLPVRGRQSPPRARMGGVAIGQAPARQGADPGRDQPRHQHRRTSRAGGAAHRAARRDRRARERHGRHRLRLRPEPVCAAGSSHHHVGQAALARRRREDRNAGALGPPLGGMSRAGVRGGPVCMWSNAAAMGAISSSKALHCSARLRSRQWRPHARGDRARWWKWHRQARVQGPPLRPRR